MKSLKNRKSPPEGKAISKPEDKIWREWFDNLTPTEHEAMLSKLGITKEDKEEFDTEMEKKEKGKKRNQIGEEE